jgi:hypothetical protein
MTVQSLLGTAKNFILTLNGDNKRNIKPDKNKKYKIVEGYLHT